MQDIRNLLYKNAQPKKKPAKAALKLSLHPAQMEIHQDPGRYKVLCTSRRFGKSRLLLTTVIEKALGYKGEYDPASPPVVLLVMPTLKQCRSIHWGPLTNLMSGHPAVHKILKNESRIALKGNLPDILLRGANEDFGDGLRGLKIYHVSFDEVQDLKPVVWTEVVYPALTDTKGSTAFFCGTPKGKGTWFYELFNCNKPGWKSFQYNIYDNPFIDPAEIELTKQSLPPNIFAQEFMAEWTIFSGQIFSSLSEDNLLEDEYAFNEIEYKEFFLGVDFGDVNPALVVIGRRLSHAPRASYVIVDSWLNPNKGSAVESYVHLDKAKELCAKWGITRSFADPSQPGRIMTWRKEQIPKLLEGYNAVTEGNAFVDTLLYQKRLKIVKSQMGLFEEMQSYHRDSDDGVVMETVAKGQDDHRCDAIRYVLATLERKSIGSVLSCESSHIDQLPDSDCLYS